MTMQVHPAASHPKGPGFLRFPYCEALAGLQERDEIVDLRRRQGLLEVLRHDVRLVAGRDLLVRVVDRLADEVGVVTLEGRVEIRADRARRVRRLEGMAAPAALGREDDLAVRGL